MRKIFEDKFDYQCYHTVIYILQPIQGDLRRLSTLPSKMAYLSLPGSTSAKLVDHAAIGQEKQNLVISLECIQTSGISVHAHNFDLCPLWNEVRFIDQDLHWCTIIWVKKSLPGGWHSLIWAIWGCAVGQGMVFWPRCPKQGIQFDLPLPCTGSEPVLNRVWYYEPRDLNTNCEHGLMVFCLIQVQRRNNWVLDASSIISLI